MIKIAILYICTGKYDVFWDDFYRSAEKYFFPSIDKEYFIFTDSQRLLQEKDNKIHSYYQSRSGWPYDTLMRYNWFCTIQDILSQFDYCYFCNANSLFLRKTTPDEFPLPTNEVPLTLSVHIGYYEDETGDHFQPERNPISKAYIPYGTKCRAYSGGFWGGTTQAFLELSRCLRDNIACDLKNGYIAVWHDQSHLERYALDHKHYIFNKGLIASEEYADKEYAILIFRDKKKYGGNNNLRDLKVKDRILNMSRRIERKIDKVLRRKGVKYSADAPEGQK